jgi:hypothetical protein
MEADERFSGASFKDSMEEQGIAVHQDDLIPRQSNIMGWGISQLGSKIVVVKKREKLNVAFGYATIENDSSSCKGASYAWRDPSLNLYN